MKGLCHQSLQNHQAGHNAPLSPIYKVVKTVYASPGRVNFQLDSTKASISISNISLRRKKDYYDTMTLILRFSQLSVTFSNRYHSLSEFLNFCMMASCSEILRSISLSPRVLVVLISYNQLVDSGPFSPVISKKGFGIGSIVSRAASVASDAAKHAYAAASTSSSNFDEVVPLKCSLMLISLPWENIAYDLLSKVRFVLTCY
ncbi:hypothetical protein L6164_015532 [Bauhinia variegata]|uniref:Uncharacterized protein n=1 Tax=Bauhinia variegata TaxID=167791 RepID=A0ACB9NML3_BAUVA|nr:hypothetical protein L6164_015532 [Bauhinia variegata]